MPTHRPWAALVAIVVGVIVTVPIAAAQSVQPPVLAYVTRVVDGDTIYAMIGGRMEAIRYIGINTPETHHPRLGAQPGGQAATEVNRQLVDGKWVQLTLDVQHRDKYGRLLAYVWVNGQMVNAQLVHRGYAQSATYPPNVRYAEWFRQIERGARDGQRGLWGDPSGAAILGQQPTWARDTARRTTAPMARQLLPGEIPPQEPIRFKTEATEHTGSVVVERSWPAGLGHPDDRNCGAGEEFVRAHVRSGGVHIRGHCRR